MAAKKLLLADILKKKKELGNDRWACFDTNPKSKNASMILSNSQSQCENTTDFYGRSKPIGLYDRPCEKDEECPFYQANENYPNRLGGCNKSTGYCQMPLGIQPLGYKYYQAKSQPLCYNCNSGSWKSTTLLGRCCEDQKRTDQYGFLKSPDYAFPNDNIDRYNAEVKFTF